MVHPVTRMDVLEICKLMNLRITQMQAIESILHCRGQLLEASSEDDYNFDKLVFYLQQKIQTMPPADRSKPLNSLQKATKFPKLSLGSSPSGSMRMMGQSPMERRSNRQNIESQQCINYIENAASRGNLFVSAKQRRGSACQQYSQHEMMMRQPTPKRKTAAELRKELDFDPTFRQEMEEVIGNIERIPGMKNHVFNKLQNCEQGWEDAKGGVGIAAGKEARRRLSQLKGQTDK